MFCLIVRPAGLALLFGLIALGGSAAEAGSFGANLNIRTQNFAQPVFVGGPPAECRPGNRPRAAAGLIWRAGTGIACAFVR